MNTICESVGVLAARVFPARTLGHIFSRMGQGVLRLMSRVISILPSIYDASSPESEPSPDPSQRSPLRLASNALPFLPYEDWIPGQSYKEQPPPQSLSELAFPYSFDRTDLETMKRVPESYNIHLRYDTTIVPKSGVPKPLVESHRSGPRVRHGEAQRR
ncbi:hypothetical protein GGR58DRAFT_509398 [Xylaria digitata]|nr:hypothetical protein GGR58DRAFT_509398 [Xylaria digitata]